MKSCAPSRGGGAPFSWIMLDKILATCMFGAVVLTALFLALPNDAFAHDIPNDVTVQLFVKPSARGCKFSFASRSKRCATLNFRNRNKGIWI
jgi:hypothetical protein